MRPQEARRSLCAGAVAIAVAGVALLLLPSGGAGDPAGSSPDASTACVDASRRANAGAPAESPFQDPPQALDYLLEVAMSPRCINCHGKEVEGRHVPLVSDDMRPHPMNVSCVNNPVHEGIARCDGGGHEPPGLDCMSCHGRTNRVPREAPPGAYAAELKLPWMMPTRELVILEPLLRIRSQTARRVALCQKWRAAEIQTAPDDPAGHFVHHTHCDQLIEWAFTPGGDRTPVPGGPESFETFKDAARMWASWLRKNESCDVFGGAAAGGSARR